MTITYIKRSTNSSFSETGGDGGNPIAVELMDQTAATTVSLGFTISSGATRAAKWVTTSSFPNQAVWGGGVYTWRFRVTTANTSLAITEIKIRRLNSTATTVRASKTTGAISIVLTTTGVLSGTITWDDDTQNPGGAVASDILEIVFSMSNIVGTMTQAGGVGENLTSNNDEIDTPIDAPTAITCTVTGKAIATKHIIHG